MRRDMDDAMQGWPYDPVPGEIIAREVRARDGRMVIQVRVELGVLQMEVTGRPDGTRPHGFATYLDYLRSRAAGRGNEPATPPGTVRPSIWTMQTEHGAGTDREFVQYYHRRVAWLALQRYERALMDADHTLTLMDFVVRHGNSEEYIDSHERFRGLVLFHRTQAAVALALERRKPDEAIDVVHDGIERLDHHHETWSADHEHLDTPNQSLMEQLRILDADIRKNYSVEKTLRERLDEAVENENYELAARLRDQIRLRGIR